MIDNKEGEDAIWILFGGCLENRDSNEFLVLHKSFLVDD